MMVFFEFRCFFIVFVVFFFQNTFSSPITFCEEGLQFRDSENCQKYYECFKNSNTWDLHEVFCPENLYFDSITNCCKEFKDLLSPCPEGSKLTEKTNLTPKPLEVKNTTPEKSLESKNFPTLNPSSLTEKNNSTPQPSISKSKSQNKKNLTKKKNFAKNWVAIFIKNCSLNNSKNDNPDIKDLEDLVEDTIEEEKSSNQQQPNNSKNQDENNKKECSCDKTGNKNPKDNIVNNDNSNSTSDSSSKPNVNKPQQLENSRIKIISKVMPNYFNKNKNATHVNEKELIEEFIKELRNNLTLSLYNADNIQLNNLNENIN